MTKSKANRHRQRSVELAPAAFILFVAVLPVSARATPCTKLSSLAIANTTILSAEDLPESTITPGRRGNPSAVETLPSHCRVQLVSKPVEDSEIHVEIWLPSKEVWNGKFEGTGNGGYSGALDYSTMQKALQESYATSGSDTGHTRDSCFWITRVRPRAPGVRPSHQWLRA